MIELELLNNSFPSPFWMFLIFPIAGFIILVRYLIVKYFGDRFEKYVIPFTEFLYEDGKTYYFKIVPRKYSNDYHNIKCYKKNKIGMYKQIGKEEMIDTELGTKRIKREVKQIMTAYINLLGEDWDGMVGDIPDHVKRESRFKELLDK